MIAVAVRSIGLMAPGLAGWRASRQILSGDLPYAAEAMPALKPDLLKPNERRRTTQTIKLALVTADDALQHTERPEALLSVFASADGDLDVINQICLALTREERPVSPTQFHNSVHNAPAGYWSIATGFRQASTSLGALTGTFGSGLLEAAVQVESEAKPVLLVSYDLPAPQPLNQLIVNHNQFGCALLLAPVEAGNHDHIAILTLEPTSETVQAPPLEDSQLEALRSSVPAARALPLLQALARQTATRLQLPYLDGLDLSVEVTP